MNPDEFKKRTQKFALDVIELTEQLPAGRTAEVLGRQLLRAGTAVGANYRAATRAQSAVHMVAKLGIVEEEADECGYWLELLVERRLVPASRAENLCREASQLVAMVVASRKTLRANLRRERQSKIENRKSNAPSGPQ
jgi:four helix bundle protein